MIQPDMSEIKVFICDKDRKNALTFIHIHPKGDEYEVKAPSKRRGLFL